MVHVLVIDNYDSFVYNIVQYLAQLGAQVDVWRNDDPRFEDDTWADPYDGILLSPGPGTPEDSGVCIDVILSQGGKIPIFGVCLGLQAIAVAFGAVVDRAPVLMHGKTSAIVHSGEGVFAGIPTPFNATRYHSLAIEPSTLPKTLATTAWTEEDPENGTPRVIMAVRHTEMPIEATQFHPESVLTENGYQIFANWLATCGDSDAPRRAVGLAPLF